jgi:AGZA family xanthine/uracil permease-like MFS transporter
MSETIEPQASENALARAFMLARHGTTVRTELIAGLTTFLTMVYIVFVNPEILGNAGMDKGAVFTATCIAAAASTLVMALYANYPVALAPGMGLNAFFAFTVVLTQHYTWQQALAGVFCSGAIFCLISVLPIREYIINAIPKSLKLAISAGIGLFLGIIALTQTKIVVAAPATLVTLGDLAAPPAALCLTGFILIAALNARRIVGATLIGILVVTVLGIPLGLAKFSGIVAAPPSLAPTLLQLDFSRLLDGSFLVVVLSFLFVDVFDNAGTLIGVAHRAGLLDHAGRLPRMREALIADSFAAMFGALIGTSTTTSYIESAAGVAAGVLRAARRDDPRLCICRGAALCRLRDGARPCRNRLGRHHRIRPRGHRRHRHAAHLFDRERHRARIYLVRALQADGWEVRRAQASGAAAGVGVRAQIRADCLIVAPLN